MSIEAVVFDMDGVLIDARDWHYQAMNRALGLFGVKISMADHLARYDGLPTKRKLEILSEDEGIASLVPRGLYPFIAEMKQRYTAEIVYTKCRPVFKQEYLLAKLHASGYKMAVASNSIRNTVETMMNLAGLSGFLDVMLSNEDVSNPKPAPDIYMLAMRMLGVQPQNTLIIEDNENGIKAALASGAHVMAVNDPSDVSWPNVLEKITSIDQGGRQKYNGLRNGNKIINLNNGCQKFQ